MGVTMDDADIFRILRSGGLLPTKWGRVRNITKLTRGQKSYFAKLKKELREVYTNRANFVVRKVGAKSAARLADQGFKIKNGRVIVRVDFDGTLRIKNGVIHIDGPYETKTVWNHSIADLLIRREDDGSIPFDVLTRQSMFKTGVDFWTVGIGGKPIGAFYETVDDLLDWIEEPDGSSNVLEKLDQQGLGGQPHLMQISVKRPIGSQRDITRAARRKDTNRSHKKQLRK